MKFLTQRFLDKPVPNHGVIYGAEWVAGAFGPPFGKAILIEEQTTNLIPVDKQKFEGWTAYSGAVVTLTQNQVVPEWGALDATRIQTSGGTNVTKYLTGVVTPSINGQAYAIQVCVKNIGTTTMRVGNNISTNVLVAAGEIKKVTVTGTGNGSSNLSFLFETTNVSDSLDIIAWHPQVEAKPYCTSFTLTTRQPEVMTLPASVLNEAEGEISVWAYEDRKTKGEAYLIGSALNTDRILLYRSSTSEKYIVYFNNTLVVTTPSTLTLGWHLHKIVWKGPYVFYSVDGVKQGEYTLPNPVSFGLVTKLYIGSQGGSMGFWNSSIDNLVIRNKTGATPEEIAIKAAEEYNNGWVPPDANTVYHQDFDGSLAAVCPFTKKITANVGNYIDDNGDAHVLVRSRYPSDGIKPAAVYTDYTDLKTKVAYVQNPKITRMGPNLLQDPSFEQGGKWGGYDNLYRKYGDAKDGSYFMRVANIDTVSQTVSVQAGQAYALSAFARKTKGSNEPRLVITWLDSAGGFISSTGGNGQVISSWQTMSVNAKAPNNAVKATINLKIKGGATDINTNAVDFDCIYFGEVESLDSPVPGYSDDPQQEIQITTELAAGDVLKLDSTKFDAQKNGTSIINDVSSSFLVHGLRIKPGVNVLKLEDALLGSGLYKVTAKFQPKYY